MLTLKTLWANLSDDKLVAPMFGYSLEPPRRGGSNEYRQSMF